MSANVQPFGVCSDDVCLFILQQYMFSAHLNQAKMFIGEDSSVKKETKRKYLRTELVC